MSASISSYTIRYECSCCGHIEMATVKCDTPIDIHTNMTIDHYDVECESTRPCIDIHFHNSDSGDNEWVCFDCIAKEEDMASRPTVAEHNSRMVANG